MTKTDFNIGDKVWTFAMCYPAPALDGITYFCFYRYIVKEIDDTGVTTDHSTGHSIEDIRKNLFDLWEFVKEEYKYHKLGFNNPIDCTIPGINELYK